MNNDVSEETLIQCTGSSTPTTSDNESTSPTDIKKVKRKTKRVYYRMQSELQKPYPNLKTLSAADKEQKIRKNKLRKSVNSLLMLESANEEAESSNIDDSIIISSSEDDTSHVTDSSNNDSKKTKSNQGRVHTNSKRRYDETDSDIFIKPKPVKNGNIKNSKKKTDKKNKIFNEYENKRESRINSSVSDNELNVKRKQLKKKGNNDEPESTDCEGNENLNKFDKKRHAKIWSEGKNYSDLSINEITNSEVHVKSKKSLKNCKNSCEAENTKELEISSVSSEEITDNELKVKRNKSKRNTENNVHESTDYERNEKLKKSSKKYENILNDGENDRDLSTKEITDRKGHDQPKKPSKKDKNSSEMENKRESEINSIKITKHIKKTRKKTKNAENNVRESTGCEGNEKLKKCKDLDGGENNRYLSANAIADSEGHGQPKKSSKKDKNSSEVKNKRESEVNSSEIPDNVKIKGKKSKKNTENSVYESTDCEGNEKHQKSSKKSKDNILDERGNDGYLSTNKNTDSDYHENPKSDTASSEPKNKRELEMGASKITDSEPNRKQFRSNKKDTSNRLDEAEFVQSECCISKSDPNLLPKTFSKECKSSKIEIRNKIISSQLLAEYGVSKAEKQKNNESNSHKEKIRNAELKQNTSKTKSPKDQSKKTINGQRTSSEYRNTSKYDCKEDLEMKGIFVK